MHRLYRSRIRLVPRLLAFACVLLAVPALLAQAEDPGAAEGSAAAASSSSTDPVPYGADEFPPWTLDLRRAEVVAFGSYPFTVFVTKAAFETLRFYESGWDRSYAPWPLASADAVEMDDDQKMQVFVAAAVVSLVVALIDWTIVSVKRSAKQRRVESTPGPSYRILERGSLPDDGTSSSGLPDAGEDDGAAVPDPAGNAAAADTQAP